MANKTEKPQWLINMLSILTAMCGLIAFVLFLPALFVVFGLNEVKPGATEFNAAITWGVPLVIFANLLSLLVLKGSTSAMRGMVQKLGFLLTLIADACIVLIIVMRFI
ncbi:hypothetical protein [Hydrogenovibrio marinus]|uniref:Uncharacterized protein n=1 Tax=Hydrogenovibrio marinus TaxID=28885 RepID=A0A067A0R9_HYDMR|nr:hypothetical protein [Hydrogenovibrio marinus]KDN96171.1 hypothetical protein EI16_07735 [Hydrogenovibrio marinus]BBN60652.1 hypothetical protein HVMH_2246 [Hydrogenovibrio marinus]